MMPAGVGNPPGAGADGPGAPNPPRAGAAGPGAPNPPGAAGAAGGNPPRARYDQAHHAQDPYADIPDNLRNDAQAITNEAIQIDDIIKRFELATSASDILQNCIDEFENNRANFRAWLEQPAQKNKDFYITYKEDGKTSFQLFPAGPEALKMLEEKPLEFLAILKASQPILANWTPPYLLDMAIPRNINEARARKAECQQKIDDCDNHLENQSLRKITREMYDNETFRLAQQRQTETTVNGNIAKEKVRECRVEAGAIPRWLIFD